MNDIIDCDINTVKTIEDKLNYILNMHKYINTYDININDVSLIDTIFEYIKTEHIDIDKNSYICNQFGEHFKKKQDYDRMIHYYTMAIEIHNNTHAMTSLALYYVHVVNDYSKAKRLFMRAVNAGDVNAMNRFGDFYRYAEINTVNMVYYYFMSIKKGDCDNLNHVLNCCHTDNLPEKIEKYFYNYIDINITGAENGQLSYEHIHIATGNVVINYLYILKTLCSENINAYLWLIILCPTNLFKRLWQKYKDTFCDNNDKQLLNNLIYLNEFNKTLKTFYEKVIVSQPTPTAKNKLNNCEILDKTLVLLNCLKICKDIKDVNYIDEGEDTHTPSATTENEKLSEQILKEQCNICCSTDNMYYMPSYISGCNHYCCLKCVIRLNKCPICRCMLIEPNAVYDINSNLYLNLLLLR